MYSLANFSPLLPLCKLMMVTKLSFKGSALGEREVGDEYLSKNSFTPFLKFSMQNSTSSYSFPGARKITWASGLILCLALNLFLIPSTPLSMSEAKYLLLVNK